LPPATAAPQLYPAATGEGTAPVNPPAPYPAATGAAVSPQLPGYSDEPLTNPYSAVARRRGYGDAELAKITLG
jgi:hypothetical protein